jgi:hypothetical protein
MLLSVRTPAHMVGPERAGEGQEGGGLPTPPAVASGNVPRAGLRTREWTLGSVGGAFPCVAQWRLPTFDSLTVAGAVPGLPEGAPASRFIPGG